MTLARHLDGLPEGAVERACAGDRAAVEVLVRGMQRPFYHLALRMLGDRTLAEDAVQECLLRVVTHLSDFRGEARFATWATRIAVHALFDFRNGLTREARTTASAFEAQLIEGRDEDAVLPDDGLLLKEVKTLCHRALLQCLDGPHRVAFVLGEILEFDATDAALVLDLAPAVYRKRLSRARAQLSEVLERQCSVHSPGAPCACHRLVDHAVARGRLDPASLEARLDDLASLRRRLVVLGAEARTAATYRADELPDVRAEVLASVMQALVPLGAAAN